MFSQLPIVSNAAIKQLLKYQDLIPAIEQALQDFSNGHVSQPVRQTAVAHKHNGFLMSMCAYNGAQNSLGMKVISLYPDRGSEAHQSTLLHFDSKTGNLLGLMEGEIVTENRTAAASAVATKYLAPPNPKVLAILGAGNQGKSHVYALTHVHKYEKILIWNRTEARGRSLCEEIKSLAKEVRFCSTVEEAVVEADVICTVTTSFVPVLHGKWLKEGVHVNCVGACRPDWRELDDECINLCDVYVDSREGALTESGDIILSKAEICGEIGEVVAGTVKATTQNRTLFKSLGMAIEDVAALQLIWDKIKDELPPKSSET